MLIYMVIGSDDEDIKNIMGIKFCYVYNTVSLG